jgi:signal transduction histidine kinase
LLARRDLPPAAREEVAEATREARALARVVDDFVAFARPGARVESAVDLVAVLERALADPSLADCDFRRDLPAARVEILGDDRLLQRALRNLLLNAAQASSTAPGAPTVDVKLAAEANRARLTIRDRGPGLPPEIADRLFEPVASGRPGGAGLGLALARRIVLLHGGRLSLANDPGGGAVAEVDLPLGNSVTESARRSPATT